MQLPQEQVHWNALDFAYRIIQCTYTDESEAWGLSTGSAIYRSHPHSGFQGAKGLAQGPSSNSEVLSHTL